MGPLLNIRTILSCIHPTFFTSSASFFGAQEAFYWLKAQRCEKYKECHFILSDKSAQTIYTLVKGLSFSWIVDQILFYFFDLRTHS